MSAPRGGGATWSAPVVVVSGKEDNAHPTVVRNPGGGYLLAWARTRDMNADGVIDRFDTADIYFATSTPEQPLTFGPDSRITTDISQDQAPAAAVGTSNIVTIIWVSYRSQNMDLWYSRGTPPLLSGKDWWSWSTPIQLTDDTDQDLDPFCLVTGAGQWFTVWASGEGYENSTNADIWLAYSPEGSTWSAPVGTIAAGADVYNCQPCLLEDDAGTFWLVWTAKTTKDSRLALASAPSLATQTWSKPRYLDALAGTAAEHPALYQDDRGTYWLAWCQREKDGVYLYVANSTDAQSWANATVVYSGTEAAHPVFIGDNRTIHLFWDAKVEGINRIMASAYQFSEPAGVDDHNDNDTNGKVPGVERDRKTEGWGIAAGPVMAVVIVTIIGAGVTVSIGLLVYFRRHH